MAAGYVGNSKGQKGLGRDTMKFSSEVSKDLSCENLLAFRISELNLMESDEEEERESRCGGVRGMAIPMCTRGASPPSSVYKKVVPESDWNTHEGYRALTKAAYSYGYVEMKEKRIRIPALLHMGHNKSEIDKWLTIHKVAERLKNIQDLKDRPQIFNCLAVRKAFESALKLEMTLPRSQALLSTGLSSKANFALDHSPVINLWNVTPEELAAQITLIDLPIFKAITPEELTTCGWTKKNKLKLAPNVVEFTRRFNHVSFWVVTEILRVDELKQRAETLSHFIRVAKKLNDLHNFHSQFAIIGALQSASIFRLSKTWSALSKKDKSAYEKMAELFGDHNNWERLRVHFNSLKLPMIPYLGLFLTDIVYIDMAHPHCGGLESDQRRLKMNNVLRVLADYQLSDYSQLKANLAVQRYLSSVRYIEELQKFVEDDHFKLSLRLEPDPSVADAHPSPKETTLFDACTGRTAANGSPTKGTAFKIPTGLPLSNLTCPTHGHQGNSGVGVKFVPGHRKARSLGTNVFRGIPFVISDPRCHEGRCDSLSSLGAGSGVLYDSYCPSAQGSFGSRHLLDDSEIDPPPPLPPDLTRTWSEISSDSEEVILELNSSECVLQGPLKRKTLLKDGKKPRVASWRRYWVQLWDGALVYYHSKSLTSRGLDRADFKTSPCKLQHLNSTEGKLKVFEARRSSQHNDTFQVADPKSLNVYKFRAPTVLAATSWLNNLNQTLSETSVHMPENLISFD